MKKIFTVLFLCVSLSGGVFAQVSLRLSTMTPSGDYYPYLLKTGFGAEFTENVDFDNDYYKLGVLVGFYAFKATQDTFQTYVVGGLNPVLSGGYDVLHHYDMIQVGVSNSLVLLPKSDITPVIGLDLCMNIFDIAEDHQDILISSKGGGWYYNWAIVPRLAVQYTYQRWRFQIGFARSMGFLGEIGSQAFWEPFISVGIGKIKYH